MQKDKKLVIITGGTKGIGKSLINKFAGLGFDVVTCSRNQAELDALKVEVETTYDIQLTAIQTDMSRKNQVTQFANAIIALNRPIDVLINNAGRCLPSGLLAEKDGQLEEAIETNLYSAYWLIRALMPNMIEAAKEEAAKSYVFNICSTASFMAFTSAASYSISKFAMYGMSKILREELKTTGIRVSSVMPGPTLTSSWDGADIPEERFIDPDDIAELIVSTYQLSGRTVVEDLIIRPQLGDL